VSNDLEKRVSRLESAHGGCFAVAFRYAMWGWIGLAAASTSVKSCCGELDQIEVRLKAIDHKQMEPVVPSQPWKPLERAEGR
jgi:hypothetical protein